jgi:LmbE family N-acetylglucosaminyl deacetylase
VSTIVSFHAHPDDEAILCGGTLAKAAAAGHRVVLVYATRGENGEVPDGFLRDGETLAQRRSAETAAAAEILGAARVEFLGYTDSGMRNTPANDAPGSFWQAGNGEAARRLEAILAEEDAGVLTVYDPNGGYGHPDHIKVNRVGLMAARLARTPRVFEATLNRDLIVRQRTERPGGGPALPDVDGIDETMGLPEAELTAAVDVTGYLDRKRAAMAAHASQISDASYFLSLGPEAFRRAFGTEWFRRARVGGQEDHSRPAALAADLFTDGVPVDTGLSPGATITNAGWPGADLS